MVAIIVEFPDLLLLHGAAKRKSGLNLAIQFHHKLTYPGLDELKALVHYLRLSF